MAIEGLDLLYLPSRDVAADLAFYRDVLGARVIFAIEAMNTRVAEVAISPHGPRLVLAGHLAGEAPVLLHRVSDLDATLTELAARGLRIERESSCRSALARPSAAPADNASASTSAPAPTSTSTSPGARTSPDHTAPSDCRRQANGDQAGTRARRTRTESRWAGGRSSADRRIWLGRLTAQVPTGHPGRRLPAADVRRPRRRLPRPRRHRPRRFARLSGAPAPVVVARAAPAKRASGPTREIAVGVRIHP